MAVAADTLVVEPLGVEAVRRLLDPPAPPCLSLYLPTHRNVPDNTVDLPTFNRLVDALGRAVSATRRRAESDRLLRPFRLLAADARVWRHARDGLAVLAAGGTARVFLLERPVRPLAVAAERFHTLPLVQAATAVDHFDVLALTSRSARVWCGRAWHDPRGVTPGPLDPLPLVAVPGGDPVEELTPDDVVTAETREPHRVKHGMGPAGRGATAFVHGGYGARRDDVDRDTEIFLRHVDGIVSEQVSRPGGRPLVLVARARLAATFRGLAKNPRLLAGHVDLDPHLLAADELAAAVAPVFARARDARIAGLVREFEQARGRGRGSGDLAEVARAAAAGQVATLLVEADRREPGRIDRASGAIEFDGGGKPPGGGDPVVAAAHLEDLVGAVAETVLAAGGEVASLARIAMPTESGVAAIYRYA